MRLALAYRSTLYSLPAFPDPSRIEDQVSGPAATMPPRGSSLLGHSHFQRYLILSAAWNPACQACRMAAAIIDNAERCAFRTHSDGPRVAHLKLRQRVQRKSTNKACDEVQRIRS